MDIPHLPLPGSPPPGTEQDIQELTQAILKLGPRVDPEEAARAARISYEHTYELALAYEITDPALIHNIKVNRGLKPRGLCKHWAEDMERRLLAEDFKTLDIHRAIGALIGVDHSTAIISQVGDGMYDGIVVDPWRRGGTLVWIATREDTSWGWVPQLEVIDALAEKNARARGDAMVTFKTAPDKPTRCLVVGDTNGPNGEARSTLDLSRCQAMASGTLSVSVPG
ncbi:MAG: hypothetical protein AAF922_19855 [Pseudomonadota bacterium]